MTHRDYVLVAIAHQETDRIPYTLGRGGGYIQAGAPARNSAAVVDAFARNNLSV